MERSTIAVVPGAVLDGVGGVPASLPGPAERRRLRARGRVEVTCGDNERQW